MPEKMVTIATFSDALEAQLIRDHLEAEGIAAHLIGDLVGGVLPGLGGTVGGIQLLVAEADVPRAEEVLSPQPEEAFEEQEGSTDIRPNWQLPTSSTEIQPPRYSPVRAADAADRPEAETDEEPAPPDSAAPTAGLETDEEEDRARLVVLTPDDFAARALRAAIIGLLALPPLLHFYSLWLLFRLAFLHGDLSESGTRKAYLATAIDLVVLIGFGLLLGQLLGE
jgi:hypothetical protein